MRNDDEALTPEEERDVEGFDQIQSEQSSALSFENLEPKVQRDFLKGLGKFLIEKKEYSYSQATKVVRSIGTRLDYFASAISEALDDLSDFLYGPI